MMLGSLYSSTNEMYFSGLPDELQVSDFPLTPIDGVEKHLEICDLCNRFNPVHYLCSSGHVTCALCFENARVDDEQAEKHSWCATCGKFLVMARRECPIALLEKMKFLCECGFIGTLFSCKKHHSGPEGLEKCLMKQEEFKERYKTHPSPKDRSPLYGFLMNEVHDDELRKRCKQRLQKTEFEAYVTEMYERRETHGRCFFWLDLNNRQQNPAIQLFGCLSIEVGMELISDDEIRLKIDIKNALGKRASSFVCEEELRWNIYRKNGQTFLSGTVYFDEPDKVHFAWLTEKNSIFDRECAQYGGLLCLSIELVPIRRSTKVKHCSKYCSLETLKTFYPLSLAAIMIALLGYLNLPFINPRELVSTKEPDVTSSDSEVPYILEWFASFFH